jgi:sterol desaturase/sphingolipid hydroxylase (fatty acid hydroxylase superfamily)
MSESLNPIGVAVPFFLVLIAIEAAVLWRQRRPVRLNDAVTDMGCGMGDQVLAMFVKGFTLALYAACHERFGLVELSVSSPWTWLLGMLGVDFLYYVFHRYGHRVHLGWAVHVVHHQSEEYNLSVALRQPWFAQLYAWVFYLPLAIAGVPTEVYATAYAINLLYQFWIHTETIGKLGPLEWFLNTPSHHRVHHGTNPEYLDKNYAGILIIWDRLFGTFEEERAPVVFGVLKPLRSWNPLWANVEPFVALAQASAAQPRWLDKLKMWIMPPSWQPGGEREWGDPRKLPGWGYDVDHAPKLHLYILGNVVLIGLGLGALLAFEASLPRAYLAIGAGFIFLTVVCWGGLFEGRRWARPLEAMRVMAMMAMIVLGVSEVS